MKISLDFRKSVDENAAIYFEKAKKEKKKIEGARKVILTHKSLLDVEAQKEEVVKQMKSKKRKQEWFEKLRWFISSDKILVIGGRDAATNEIVIKKHSLPDDVIFHTDMAGSPFVVVKNETKGLIPQSTLDEAAVFTAVFSRGWKLEMATLPVFSCKPDQVSKTPNPGESMAKGAFVVRGQLTYYSPQMIYAVGISDGRIMGGPPSAVKANCEKYVLISQGSEKPSDLAKLIRKKIGGELDDIIRVIPQGSRIAKGQ